MLRKTAGGHRVTVRLIPRTRGVLAHYSKPRLLNPDVGISFARHFEASLDAADDNADLASYAA